MGSNHCSQTLRIREFLTRNNHPYAEIDLDREADVQEMLDRFHVSIDMDARSNAGLSCRRSLPFGPRGAGAGSTRSW